MACVKFLLLALAYMCSNEVKQRCVLRLHVVEDSILQRYCGGLGKNNYW